MNQILLIRFFFKGRTNNRHGSRRTSLVVELRAGHDPRRTVRRADVSLHGGVRGFVHQAGDHGQRKVSVSRIHSGIFNVE
jgi:hypothetical protein